MSKPIIAVSALVPGNKKVYILDYGPKEDRSLQVTTTFDKNEAFDFGTVELANKKIARFFNPFDRTYTAEKIMVDPPKENLEFPEHKTVFK